MLDLAKHIIKTKTGHFKPAQFEDRYEDALKELLRKKDKGEKIEAPREPRSDNVVNLMDALRRSVQAKGGHATHSRRRHSTERRKHTRKRTNARHRKAS
jgi:DNA end-binding protein Ku